MPTLLERLKQKEKERRERFDVKLPDLTVIPDGLLREVERKVSRAFLEEWDRRAYLDPQGYRCPECGYEYEDRTNVINHIMTHHEYSYDDADDTVQQIWVMDKDKS
jgi:hypothetical protein